MQRLPLKIAKSLENRKREKAFRELSDPGLLIDFSSNDYLGFSSPGVVPEVYYPGNTSGSIKTGAGGSRLLTGNHSLYPPTEELLAQFHRAEAALIFNSGYDANLGLLSSVARRGDLILFDELAHASIRDGVSLSQAKGLKFRHNDLGDLERLLRKAEREFDTIFVVTESVFSMDGDSPDLADLAGLCENFKSFLIVDEAHAIGVFGQRGEGLIQEKNLQERVFARIVTFGKAMGTHGAVVLGSSLLKDYLINFARSFIYTTALPPHTVGTVLAAYRYLQSRPREIEELQENIRFFKAAIGEHKLDNFFINSDSAIQCCVIPGNEHVKKLSRSLAGEGFDVRAILSPTVPAGKERLRICLHAINSKEEISEVLTLLKDALKK